MCITHEDLAVHDILRRGRWRWWREAQRFATADVTYDEQAAGRAREHCRDVGRPPCVDGKLTLPPTQQKDAILSACGKREEVLGDVAQRRAPSEKATETQERSADATRHGQQEIRHG